MSFREVFHPQNYYRLIHLCTSVLKPKTGAVLNKVERMIMICPNYYLFQQEASGKLSNKGLVGISLAKNII